METKVTKDQYDSIWLTECAGVYPMVDRLETEMGFALDKGRLEGAARVLACPLKKNPPNWQHGRVIYSCLRRHLEDIATSRVVRLLDIGTAKGFSALCALWAMTDAQRPGSVTSVDVIDPRARVRRNTVAEVDGLLTLDETLRNFPMAGAIKFEQSTGAQWLALNRAPLDFAFVDGKHNYSSVSQEIKMLAACQYPGGLAIFDDVHVPEVRRAVEESEHYSVRFLEVLPNRAYAIGTRN